MWSEVAGRAFSAKLRPSGLGKGFSRPRDQHWQGLGRQGGEVLGACEEQKGGPRGWRGVREEWGERAKAPRGLFSRLPRSAGLSHPGRPCPLNRNDAV